MAAAVLPNVSPKMFARAARLKPLLKVAGQSGVLAGAADLSVQLATKKPQSTKDLRDIDLRRTASFVAFGFGYSGLIQRFVYRGFDRVFGIQNTFRVIMCKVAADAFIHAPIMYVPSFYITTSLLQGYSISGSVDRLRAAYSDTLKAYVSIWFLPMAVCFRFVPEVQRANFVAVCAYIEKGIYSMMDQRKSQSKDQQATALDEKPIAIERNITKARSAEGSHSHGMGFKLNQIFESPSPKPDCAVHFGWHRMMFASVGHPNAVMCNA